MSGTAGHLIKGSVLLSAGNAATNLLSTLSTIVLARLLVPADFGIFVIGSTVILLLSSFTDLSIGAALIQRDEVTRDHLDTAWTLNLLRVLPLGFGLMALAPVLANVFNDPRLVEVFIALAAGWMVSGLISPKLSLLQRELRFGQQVILNISQKAVGVLLTVLFAILYKSYWALVIGTIGSSVAAVAVSFALAPYMPRFSLKSARDLFSFSLWVWFGQIVDSLNWRADNLIVGKFLNAADIGYYSMGSNLSLMATRQAIQPLTKTLFPGYSAIKHDLDRLRRAYQRAQTFVTAISLPVGIGVALLADPLVRLMLGEGWLPVIFVIQTLSLIYAIQTIGTQVGPLAMALGETRMMFNRSVKLLCIRMPILLVGVYVAGIKGMVVARVIAGLISISINLKLTKDLVGLSMFSQVVANGRALASTAIMSGCVIAARAIVPSSTQPVALAIQIVELSALGAAVYCASSYLMWVIAGRPAGPEQDAGRLLGTLLTRVRAKVAGSR